MSEIKEHPLMFSGPMVRATLERRKWQTRRVITSRNKYDWAVGDHIWVKETWQSVPIRKISAKQSWWVPPSDWPGTDSSHLDPRNLTRAIVYRADGELPLPGGWKPFIIIPGYHGKKGK